MKILALDSSGLVASVAVVEDDGVNGNLLAEYTVNYKKTHSQTLLPMLDEIARMIELDLNTIDAIAVAAGPADTLGQEVEQDPLQLPCVDGAPVGWKASLETDDNFVLLKAAGRALQDFLPGAADREQAALAGTLGFEGEGVRLAAELDRNIILQGDARVRFLPVFPREPSRVVRDVYAQAGGRREGISLHMVNGKDIVAERILPGQ